MSQNVSLHNDLAIIRLWGLGFSDRWQTSACCSLKPIIGLEPWALRRVFEDWQV
jgi:hypothetical protein